MYVNERDQINYHGFLRVLREMNKASQEAVSKDICTVSGMNRFENGNRVAEKLMRDRLTARLGISGEKYEDYLQPKEYVRWEHRLRIVKAIEKKNLALAKAELDAYRGLPRLNCVNVQFVEAMQFMIMSEEKASKEVQLECIERAVKCTISNVGKFLRGDYLLSDQEINLISEYMGLCPAKKAIKNEAAWRIAEYEKLISYMDASCWESLQKAKVYPKVVYSICKLMREDGLSEERCRRGLELCNQAIELLRDNCRLYYFIELTEAREQFAEFLLECRIEDTEKVVLEDMLKENLAWANVFRELYAEYKVAPYMSDFCYLYYETECHDMVEVIETRRNMLGLSRVKLGDGICTDKTIVRFEREGRNPNIDLVRLLFERMGLCAEYRRARVITNDVEALMLSSEVSRNINDYDFENLETNLVKLEKRLHMQIPHNKQEIERIYTVFNYLRKTISKEELYDRTIASLEHTLPVRTIKELSAKYISRNEITGIYDIAFKMEGDLSEKCFDIIDNMCNEMLEKEVVLFSITVYEVLVGRLASYYGNIGNYDASNKLITKMMKECLAYRKSTVLADNLYCIIWNYLESSEKADIDVNYVKEQFNKCIVISELIKKKNRVAFFRDKKKKYD